MHIPPLCIRNHPVIVFVDFREKPVQLSVRNRDSGTRKGISQFHLVDFSVVISIDALEHLP